ncbi:MAG: hypothetical protein KIS92_18720 [Planctomycetota bacterium]|nr:hypothetical protein [Planctomycetota bacterium]
MRGMLLALLLVGLGYGCYGQAQAADAKEETLNGTFAWSRENGKTHPIKAVFTQTGDKTWNVVFTFKWGKDDQVWKGTATGELGNGEVKGDAKTPDGKRNFSFVGGFKDGKLDFTHKEGRNDTGTMSLKKG